jgi:hypothetical protein
MKEGDRSFPVVREIAIPPLLDTSLVLKSTKFHKILESWQLARLRKEL